MSAVLTLPQPAATTTPRPAGGVSISPRPYRWTIAEYQRLHRAGLFPRNNTLLVGGEILEMPTPGPRHSVVLRRADRWLSGVCPAGHHVRNQAGFDVGTRNDPGPDLAVVPGDDTDYLTANPRTAALVVEVADSSLALVTTEKAELYATAGVPEYWVFDLEHNQLVVFRDPTPLPAGLGATAYRTHLTFGPTDTVAPLAAPAAVVTVADLLP